MDSILAPLADSKSFQSFAGVASIFSLLLTGFVVWKLRRINARLVLNARREEWLLLLRRYNRQLARSLATEGESEADIRRIFVLARPTLRALQLHLPLFSAKWLRLLLLTGRIGRYTEDGVLRWLHVAAPRSRLPRKIHEGLLELSETLQEDIEQAKIYRAQV